MTAMRQERRLARNAEVSEKAIEKYLVQLVKEAGGLCLKYTNANETGYPDRLLLFSDGKAGWVEVKSAGKKPTALQSARMCRLWGMGFPVWVCDSREKAAEIVESMKKPVP